MGQALTISLSRSPFSCPLSLEPPVLDAVGFDGLVAEATFLVFLIGFEVAFEPFDVGFAFEGEDVGAEAVEEEAAMEGMTDEEKEKYEGAMAKGDVMRPGPGNTGKLIWMKGSDLEGIELNYTWGFYKKPGIWHRGPGKSDGAHVHPSDEVLVFVGTDPSDINYLGAEISIDMGEERERYVFDKPTAVVCPKGVAHAPIITRYVDRPFAFFMMNLASEYKITYV